MDETLDLSTFVERNDAGIAHMTLAVEGVGCAGCIRKIESGLTTLPGIIDARLNFTQRRLTVEWRENEIDAQRIVKALESIGYPAHPFTPERIEADDTRQAKWLLKCLAVAGFAAMNVMLLSISVWSGNVSDMTQETRDLFHWLSALIALPAAAYAGQPFFQSALRAARSRQLNMDVPISVGVVLALGLSVFETATHATQAYFDSAIMLLFFLLCGRYLDQAMRRKTRLFAGNLASFKADFAHRLDAHGELTKVPAAALQPGDRVLVRPGERIPADGAILAGASSEIDESLVTGETMHRSVGAGATVYAGSINLSAALTMTVTAAGTGTLVDEIERLLQKATQAKSRTVRLADRAARLYAPVVHATAAVTLVGWLLAGASFHDAMVTAIAVLIITCPCALALAIPAVQVVAAGSLFRSGVILNCGDAIERLADVDTVVFDKTGTLTLPDPCVEQTPDIDPGMLERAARLALSSRHPLATALARLARERIPYPGAVEEPGQGVRALIDGKEARLGNAKFCGLADGKAATRARRRCILHCLRLRRSDCDDCGPPDLAARCRRGDEGAARARSRPYHSIGRSAGRSRAGRAPAWPAAMARRSDARGEDRSHRASEIPRVPRADGRRRLERCAGACRRARLIVADYRHPHHAGACRRGIPRRQFGACAARFVGGAAGARPDEAEPGACGDLQCARSSHRDRRLRHPPDCGRGHVGLVDPGHAERVARATRDAQRADQRSIMVIIRGGR